MVHSYAVNFELRAQMKNEGYTKIGSEIQPNFPAAFGRNPGFQTVLLSFVKVWRSRSSQGTMNTLNSEFQITCTRCINENQTLQEHQILQHD